MDDNGKAIFLFLVIVACLGTPANITFGVWPILTSQKDRDVNGSCDGESIHDYLLGLGIVNLATVLEVIASGCLAVCCVFFEDGLGTIGSAIAGFGHLAQQALLLVSVALCILLSEQIFGDACKDEDVEIVKSGSTLLIVYWTFGLISELCSSCCTLLAIGAPVCQALAHI
eukprot:gb/GECH01001337.1/.p1 GENE.gb/GECH01001337.1/~~gb/GECH01001337.1/.p1  ORF type:complete len:171 (+),score=29.82 gb/GECH01001337.1/:1-513(+)